jgi:CheY-like chemotaxis protein
VDDHPDTTRTLGAFLRLCGYAVETRPDGPSALEAIDGFRPDVALVDIGLPGMDGWELAGRLRERLGADLALVVAVTGYGDEGSRRRSREAGIDHHFTKPVEPKFLLALLAAAQARVNRPR